MDTIGLMYAQNTLSSISENQDLWIEQYRGELLERDRISGLAAAEDIGISKGKISTYKELVSKGLLAEDIAARNLGLTLENLKKEFNNYKE